MKGADGLYDYQSHFYRTFPHKLNSAELWVWSSMRKFRNLSTNLNPLMAVARWHKSVREDWTWTHMNCELFSMSSFLGESEFFAYVRNMAQIVKAIKIWSTCFYATSHTPCCDLELREQIYNSVLPKYWLVPKINSHFRSICLNCARGFIFISKLWDRHPFRFWFRHWSEWKRGRLE